MLTEIEGGLSRVFRISLPDGTPMILKTYENATWSGPAKEAYAAGLLKDIDIAVSRFLIIDESCTRLPIPFSIMTCLPGATLASLRDAPGIADVYREMGALLRKLHSVQLPAYGQFDATGIRDPAISNAQYMRNMCDHSFAQFRKFGADPALAEKLQDIVRSRSDLLAESRGAVFAHNDFHVRNLLATPAGDGLCLSGLVDFGNAHAADPLFDLTKTLFMADHDAPGASGHIRAGYGALDHSRPEATIWVYMLIHRVAMWWWLRQVGRIADGEKDLIMEDLRQMAEFGYQK